MSDDDKELEAEKYDINELVTPKSYETWGVRVEKEEDDITPARKSPFSRRSSE